MTSLLQLCQFVAKDIGILPPITVVNNPDPTVAGFLSQASRACRTVHEAIDWPILMREHSFACVDATAEYDLPSDFARFIGETAWDQTQYWQMRGPLSAKEWQIQNSGLVQAAGLQKQWRVKRAAASIANKFQIIPTPADTNTVVFEYISNAWATAVDGTTLRADWVLDTDILIIDEDLVELDMTWRMLKRLGRDYKDEKKEARDNIDQVKAREGGMPVLNVTPPWSARYPVNTPETGIGS